MLPNRRTFLKTAIGSIAGFSLPHIAPGYVLAQTPSVRITAVALAEDLFLLSGAGANVIATTGTDGVVMVDGGLAENVPALLQAVSGLPRSGRIHTLFNTCWFPEQTGANQALGQAGATIIAHENTRLWMTTDITRPWEKRTFLPAPKEARPSKTFYDKGTLSAGDERVEYGYMLQAHTDGDIYVFFSKANVLAVGGVILGEGWPLIDWWTGGWIGGLVNGIETLLKVSNAQTKIVAANGPVLTRAELEAQHQMYKTISMRLQALLRKGYSTDEVIAAEPAKEFNAKMGNPETFLSLAFESLWGQLSPDA